ncbi:MAG: LysR family transcriptional regulator, partial [Gaiellaceae bacterium]
MNLRALECFVAVVDEGSFTRAARRVGITQPSLSQHIRTLEAELEGPVFSRLPRGVALTPAGRTLLPEARIAMRAVERGLRGARSTLAV